MDERNEEKKEIKERRNERKEMEEEEKKRKEKKEKGRLVGWTSPAAAGVGWSWPEWVDKAPKERVDSGESVVQYRFFGVLQTMFRRTNL